MFRDATWVSMVLGCDVSLALLQKTLASPSLICHSANLALGATFSQVNSRVSMQELLRKDVVESSGESTAPLDE